MESQIPRKLSAEDVYKRQSYGSYQFGYGAYDFAREFVGAMHMIVIPTLIITVIFSVVYFILTNYILSHRLNLE